MTLLALPKAGWDLRFCRLLFFGSFPSFFSLCFNIPDILLWTTDIPGTEKLNGRTESDCFPKNFRAVLKKHPFLHFCLEIIFNSRPSVRLMSHAAWDPVMVPVHEHRASRVRRNKDGGPMARPRKTGTNQCQR